MANPTVAQTMTPAEMAKRIADLEAEIAARNASKYQLRIKLSAKGCVCVYGLNSRFPVSLYKDQWRALAKFVETILKFITDNEAQIDKLNAARKGH